MNTNILITSVGKRVALTKCFKESLRNHFPKSKVLTADMNPKMAPAGYYSDYCFEVPEVTNPDYPRELLKICLDNEIGMVIPTIDTELLVLGEIKDFFESNGIHVIVSDKSLISCCRDKRETISFLQKRGIRMPALIDKNRPSFPMFAKPIDGSLSNNLHCLKCESDLTPEILNDSKLLFMEYIDKNVYKEYTVDAYYGRDNNVKCIIPRERIVIRAGEINQGKTSKNILVPFVLDKLGHIDGCVGCICAQFFLKPDSNDIVGIEVNPRFGGGYPLSYMAGGNFPDYLIREYFLNESINYYDGWRDGLLMLRFDDAVFV